MEFRYYIPKKFTGISPLIWEQTSDSPMKWKMLPEFNIDLIFNLDEPWTVHSECYSSKSYNPTANFCFLSGLHTKPLYVEFPRCHMFGIRLNTIAANLLFGLPCRELKNWSFEGDTILKREITRMQDNISSIPDFQTRAVWLEAFIGSLLSCNADFNTAMRISSLLNEIYHRKSTGESCRIEDLTGYSRMHTLRIFQKWFGVSPGEAIAFKRYEKALEQIHCSSDSLTHIGLNAGFYDQAHFIRVFRQFAEMSPKQYASIKSEGIGQLPY